jgi:hypothetical protein
MGLAGSFALVIVPLQYLLVWNGNYLLYSLFIPLRVLVLPLLGLLSVVRAPCMSACTQPAGRAPDLRVRGLAYSGTADPAIAAGPGRQCLPAGVPAARRAGKRCAAVSLGKLAGRHLIAPNCHRRKPSKEPSAASECQRARRRAGIADAVHAD